MITSFLTSNHETQKPEHIHGNGNPGPDLRQAQQSGGVKPVNGIPTFPLINGSQKWMTI